MGVAAGREGVEPERIVVCEDADQAAHAVRAVVGTGDVVLVKASPGPDDGFDCWELGRCRWGDYSGATPDPAAPLTGTTGRVWLSNEWVNGVVDPFNATWRTWNWAATP